MKNLIKWEMKQTFKSKAFWGIGCTFILGTLIFSLIPIIDGGRSNNELFLSIFSNFNSLILLIIGIYAGMRITGDLEDRKIQAAVMAGNSRFSVVATKLFVFSLSVAIFTLLSTTINSLVLFLIKGSIGIDTNFFREVIMRTICFSLVEISFASICFFLSTLVKNIGAAITINLITLVALNSIGQSLIGKEWAAGFIKFTPVGQTFLIIADASTKNIINSLIASILGITLVLILSYIKFRKQELK